MTVRAGGASRGLVLAGAMALAAAAPWPTATSDPGQSGLVMLGGALLFALVAATAGSLTRRRIPAGLLCFGAFVAWAALGAARGIAPFQAERMLAVWTAGLAVCAAVVLGADTTERARWTGRALVAAAAVLAGYGVAHWYFALHAGTPPPDADTRLSATFANADCFAALLVLALGLGMGLVGEAPPRERVAVSVALFVVFVALLLTASRAGVVGAVAAVAAYGFVVARQRRTQPLLGRALAAPALAALLLIGTGSLTASGGRWMQLLTSESAEGVSVRSMVLQGSPATILRSPLWGWGPGNFAEAFLHDRPHGAFRGYVNQAHSDPIQIAVETGLIGLALWAAALLLGIRGAMRAPRYAGSLSAGAMAGLVGVAVYGLLNFAVPVPADFVWISAVLGLALACGRLEPARPGEPTGGMGARRVLAAAGLAVVALGCAAFTGNVGWRDLAAQRWGERAAAQFAALRWEDGLDAVNHALAAEPENEQYYLLRAQIEERMALFDGDRSRQTQALDDMRHALALNPTAKGLRLEAAHLFISSGDNAAAEEVLLAAREACPTDVSPWAELAKLYEQTNRLAKAAQCYRHVMIDFPEARPRLARVLVAAEATGAGGANMLNAWRQEPGADSTSLRDLGLQAARFAESINRATDAEPFYQLLLGWDSADTCAALGLAHQQQARGRLQQAASTLQQALKGASPSDAGGCYEDAYLALTDLQIARGDRAGAVGRLRQYLQSSPWSAAAALKLADAYATMGRVEAATDVLRDAVQHSPAAAALQTRLAELYRRQGMTGLAAEAEREARRLASGTPESSRDAIPGPSATP